ncbi:hypothetical protein GOP47_0000114 [Adiantum capillus-veneris]|uniref:Uncharacterized protein n=1 Tax=Adiantum capillus-veneris TaxID=13818 RepID=A0A9D4VDB4_ADICA|nr:hypothetical protein GOP47_0000114 [Adiantum capillus-veneris]
MPMRTPTSTATPTCAASRDPARRPEIASPFLRMALNLRKTRCRSQAQRKSQFSCSKSNKAGPENKMKVQPVKDIRNIIKFEMLLGNHLKLADTSHVFGFLEQGRLE